MNRTRTAIRPCRFGFAILVILTIGINAKSLFGSINLAWDPNSESFLVGYNVYRSTQPGVFTAPPLNGATPVTATAFTDSTAQNNQTYYYVVRAVGTGGQESTNSNMVVAAPPDIVPPSVSIAAPANGASVVGTTVVVSATASDNVGVVGVQFKLDGANLGAEDTASPYTFSWNTTTVSNGVHSLTAVARDAAGNQTTSAAISVTVNNPDTVPPTVSVTSPASGATVSGTITISAAASDNIAVVGVQFKLDGANLGAEDTVSPYSISWNTTTVSNGVHSLSAVARDAAGNQTTSATVSVSASTTMRIEETSAAITYSGTWSLVTNAGMYSGGTMKSSMDANAQATLSFTGTSVTFITMSDEWSGIAQIYVDGSPATQVDLYASPAIRQAKASTVSGLTPGPHTVGIGPIGRKNANAQGYWVQVDAIDVTTTSNAIPTLSSDTSTASTGASAPTSTPATTPSTSGNRAFGSTLMGTTPTQSLIGGQSLTTSGAARSMQVGSAQIHAAAGPQPA